jgi:large subunit ribosomal protein L6
MSRIGKRPVDVPKGVTVTAGADFFEVKGPKGTVRRALPADVQVPSRTARPTSRRRPTWSAEVASRMTGTVRSHLANAVNGVDKGYEQAIKLEGTGYKVEELKGQRLTLTLGLSHKVIYEVPKAVAVKVPPTASRRCSGSRRPTRTCSARWWRSSSRTGPRSPTRARACASW